MMAHPQVLSTKKVKALFGSFAWTPNGKTRIVIDREWRKENLVEVRLPGLVGKQTYGGKVSVVTIHRKAEDAFKAVFSEIVERGLQDDILFFGGAWVPRRMRGRNSLSRHSWGIAMDLNPQWNRFGSFPAGGGREGSVRRLVPVFEKHGFAWGGWWRRPDGMHFEYTGAVNARPKDTKEVKVIYNAKVVGQIDWPLWGDPVLGDHLDDQSKLYIVAKRRT